MPRPSRRVDEALLDAGLVEHGQRTRPGARIGTAAPAARQSLAIAAVALLASLGACTPAPDEGWLGYAEGETLRLSAGIAGTVTRLHVARGDVVRAGAPLFVLEERLERYGREEAATRVAQARAQLENLRKGRRPDEIAALQAQLAQAQAALTLSTAEFARQSRLVGEHFVSPAALDQARAARDRDRARLSELQSQLRIARQGARPDELEAARQAVEAAEAQLGQADWRVDQKTQHSPVAGDVVDVYFRQGEWVPAGSPVLALLPPGARKARFFVPPGALGAMRLGDAVEIRCDGCGAPIAARVSFVAREAEYTAPIIYSDQVRSTLVFLVEALPDAAADARRLHPGLPLRVRRAPTPGHPEASGTSPPANGEAGTRRP